MKNRVFAIIVATLAFACSDFVSTSVMADDWPQWMGPTRDGIYRETEIVDAIPEHGQPYWTEPLQPQGGMSIARPQREGDWLFVGGFKNASLMLRLMTDKPAVSVVWESEVKMSLSPATMTPLIHDGIIFGCDNELGALLAVRASDGERLWQSYLPIRPSNVRRPECVNDSETTF